jgi:hypothetical protein
VVSNPPRQKGTTEETAVVNDWNWDFVTPKYKARRMPASSVYDIQVEGAAPPADVLMTRADYGERLVTLRFQDFAEIWANANAGELDLAPELHIEVKRYKRFSLHTIFFKKFGKAKP